MASKVGTKGQIVIAKEIRDELGIEPGWTAFQQVVDGHVEVYFLPPKHNRSLGGVLAPYIKRSMPASEEGMRQARELARTLQAFEDAFMDHYPDASDDEIDRFVSRLRDELLEHPEAEREIRDRARAKVRGHAAVASK